MLRNGARPGSSAVMALRRPARFRLRERGAGVAAHATRTPLCAHQHASATPPAALLDAWVAVPLPLSASASCASVAIYCVLADVEHWCLDAGYRHADQGRDLHSRARLPQRRTDGALRGPVCGDAPRRLDPRQARRVCPRVGRVWRGDPAWEGRAAPRPLLASGELLAQEPVPASRLRPAHSDHPAPARLGVRALPRPGVRPRSPPLRLLGLLAGQPGRGAISVVGAMGAEDGPARAGDLPLQPD